MIKAILLSIILLFVAGCVNQTKHTIIIKETVILERDIKVIPHIPESGAYNEL